MLIAASAKGLPGLLALVLAMVLIGNDSGAAEGVGVRHMAAYSTERRTDIDVTVWYPASPGGHLASLGGSLFFEATSAMLDAPISQGKYPVVLLSHGAGLAGNAQAMSWIATPLAQRGLIVAAPTHPGNTGPNRSASETMKLWLRPADLSATLDALQGDALFEGHIKPGKVGALGLSMGGSTALMIAGARLDAKRLADYCDVDARNPSLCGWIKQSGVDLHAMDWRLAGRDNRDKRVGFAMAIDPAPVDVFDDASFPSVKIPIAIANLGKPSQIPATAQAAEVAKSIPDSRYITIEDASHFSMFAECKPDGANVAREQEIGDPICTDGDGRSRHVIHARLIEIVTEAFGERLGKGR